MNLLCLLGLKVGREVLSSSEVDESEGWLDRFTEKHDRLMRQQERYEIACLSGFYDYN
jgi:hypothetical protein